MLSSQQVRWTELLSDNRLEVTKNLFHSLLPYLHMPHFFLSVLFFYFLKNAVFWMLCGVTFSRTDVSEERIAS
jgi:hypothetical protein